MPSAIIFMKHSVAKMTKAESPTIWMNLGERREEEGMEGGGREAEAEVEAEVEAEAEADV